LRDRVTVRMGVAEKGFERAGLSAGIIL